MALDALGRIIVGSGHFASSALPLVSQGIQAIGTMATASGVKHVTVGGGHLSQGLPPVETVAIARGIGNVPVGIGHFPTSEWDAYWASSRILEEKLGDYQFLGDKEKMKELDQLFIEDGKRYQELCSKTGHNGMSIPGQKPMNAASYSRLNFPHTTRNGTVRIAGDDRAWEAYQAYRDAQDAHLRDAAKETALALLSEAAGNTPEAIEHAGLATAEIAQSVWERWKRDYEQIRDLITTPSYAGFGIPDRDP